MQASGGSTLRLGVSARRLPTVLRVAAVCSVAAGVWIYLNHLVVLSPWHGESDLKIYRGAVLWWWDQKPLYSFRLDKTPYGFTYPPVAAVLMLPWAWVTQTTAMVVNGIVSGLVLLGTTWWLVSPIATRHGWSRWFAVGVAVPLVAVMEPVRETLGLGQVNLYLVALVLVDVAALRHGRRFAGLGIGLATAIKLTPGLFIVYLVLTGRWRAAGVAVGTFCAATLLAFGIDARASSQFWTETLFQTSRVGPLEAAPNQSVLGLLARLAVPQAPSDRIWVIGVGVVLAVGMTRARLAWRRGDELAGITLTGLTACLISPISWTHHLFWVVPAVAVLVDIAAGTPDRPGGWSPVRGGPRQRAWGAGVAAFGVFAVFALSIVWYVTNTDGDVYGAGPARVVLGNAYAFVMLALLALLPARGLPVVGRRRPPSAALTSAPPLTAIASDGR